MRRAGRGGAVVALCAMLAPRAAAFPLLYDGNGGALLTTALGANLSLNPSAGGARCAGVLSFARPCAALSATARVSFCGLARHVEHAPRRGRQHRGGCAAQRQRGRG
jgi:hypothetical protein